MTENPLPFTEKVDEGRQDIPEISLVSEQNALLRIAFFEALESSLESGISPENISWESYAWNRQPIPVDSYLPEYASWKIATIERDEKDRTQV